MKNKSYLKRKQQTLTKESAGPPMSTFTDIEDIWQARGYEGMRVEDVSKEYPVSDTLSEMVLKEDTEAMLKKLLQDYRSGEITPELEAYKEHLFSMKKIERPDILESRGEEQMRKEFDKNFDENAEAILGAGAESFILKETK